MEFDNPDNLPVANRASADVLYSDRLGICQKCSTSKRPVPKVTINGIKMCPDCGTKVESKTRRVSRVQDPGEDAFKKVIRKDSNGKEYVEMVPKSGAIFKRMAKGKISQVNSAAPTEPVQPAPNEQSSLDFFTSFKPKQLLSALLARIEAVNVKTIDEFKSRDKVIKSLNKLKSQVDDLTGGNNE